MKLVSLLQERLVLCGSNAADYAAARNQLLNLLNDAVGIPQEGVRKALAEREALASTVVAPGIAFPHARTDLVDDFYMLIGTFPEGFAAPGEDTPVRLVILYLMSEGTSNLYLRCVSSMARFLSAPENLENLVAAKDPDEAIAVLDRAGLLVKDTVTAQDVMVKDPVRCTAANTLREMADLLVKEHITHVPVVDDDGGFIGMVTANRLLKVGLPEYLLQMENVDFLRNFEPFQDLLKQEQSMTVREIMDPDPPRFLAHTPMIVVASKLVREDLESAAVVDETGKLVGLISGLEFVHKVVRA